MQRLLLAGLALLISPAAGRATGPPLEPGTWGGDRAILTVVKDGAEVEFECARGRVTGPIRLDARGDFDRPGTFSPEGHGPARGDVPAAEARYQGHVEGGTMTLRVRVGDERIGPYELTRGREPEL